MSMLAPTIGELAEQAHQFDLADPDENSPFQCNATAHPEQVAAAIALDDPDTYQAFLVHCAHRFQ